MFSIFSMTLNRFSWTDNVFGLKCNILSALVDASFTVLYTGAIG